MINKYFLQVHKPGKGELTLHGMLEEGDLGRGKSSSGTAQPQQGLREEPRAAAGTAGTAGAGPGDTHIVVVAHVHATVQHHVLASDGHQDAAPAHVLPSTWTQAKQQENIKIHKEIPGKYQQNTTREIPGKHQQKSRKTSAKHQ